MPLPLLQAQPIVLTCYVLPLFNISKYTTFKQVTRFIISFIDLPTVLTLNHFKMITLSKNQLIFYLLQNVLLFFTYFRKSVGKFLRILRAQIGDFFQLLRRTRIGLIGVRIFDGIGRILRRPDVLIPLSGKFIADGDSVTSQTIKTIICKKMSQECHKNKMTRTDFSKETKGTLIRLKSLTAYLSVK